jgi:transposase-like protein
MTKRRNAEFWKAHVATIKREGVSTAAYAKRHDLSVKSLYGWQHKLNAAPAIAHLPSSFVSLRIADSAASQLDGGCTLFLGGLRLEMAALPPPAWLAELGRVIPGAR